MLLNARRGNLNTEWQSSSYKSETGTANPQVENSECTRNVSGDCGVHVWTRTVGEGGCGDEGCGLQRDGFSLSISTGGYDTKLYNWEPWGQPWANHYIFV